MIATESSLDYGREQLVKFLGLTEREQEVAVLISLGFTNRQIAPFCTYPVALSSEGYKIESYFIEA